MFLYTLAVRFRDLDALNHVNNSVYLTYLEESRIAFMRETQVGSLDDPEQGTILAHCNIDYRLPAVLGDTLVIRVWVGEIRRSSFELRYLIERKMDATTIAEAQTIQVCYNYITKQPIRLSSDSRSKLLVHQQ